MGLFDKRDKKISKKAGDEFDSPVEKIDLAAPEPEPAPAEPASGKLAAQKEDEDEFDSSFGIDKAIELMRTLPSDNVELVVQVVKLTLESTKIRITTIIEDATRKQEDIQGRIKVLKEEIAEFEKRIATRREEIGTLEADFEETSTVKERLILAEKLTKKPAASGKASAPAPGKTVDKPGDSGPTRPGGLGAPSPAPSSPLGKTGGKPTVVAKK